jgi:hypothetical protein
MVFFVRNEKSCYKYGEGSRSYWEMNGIMDAFFVCGELQTISTARKLRLNDSLFLVETG